MTEEHKYNPKHWTKLKAESSWTIFKIMSEFVEGFEKMSKIGPCVSIFGSARTDPENEYYKMGVEVAKEFTNEGYGIITGGGPGIMEAANKGAQEAGGKSVGLNIDIPMEQFANPYVDPEKLITFNYFFIRKVMFVKYAQAIILLPGGFGTMDELFESLTLIQTKKIDKVPIVMMGKKYWAGLLDWLNNTMAVEGNINPIDMELFTLTDDVNEAVKAVSDFYKDDHELRPNF